MFKFVVLGCDAAYLIRQTIWCGRQKLLWLRNTRSSAQELSFDKLDFVCYSFMVAPCHMRS